MLSPAAMSVSSLALFGAGVWLATPLEPAPKPASFFIIGWLTSLVLTRLRSTRARVTAALASLPLAYLAGYLHIQNWRYLHSDIFSEGASYNGTVQVVDAPDVRSTYTFLTVQPTSQINNRIRLKTDRYPPYAYGDTLQVQGKLEHPEQFESFNYPLFLQRYGITAILDKPSITEAIPTQKPSILGLLYTLRGKVEHHISTYIPEPEASFLGGILLGSKRAIPEYIQEQLKVTGTTHIVAISGANITILLGLLLNALPLYSPQAIFWTTTGIALFITTLTGGSASVVRGATVAVLGNFIRWRGRKPHPTGIILISLAGMLIVNPLLLKADPGFQLSFAAYAGLLYLGSGTTAVIDRTSLTRWLPSIAKSSLSETTAATIGTAPLSYTLFGTVSPLGLLVNPFVLWLLPAVTLLGLLLISIGWIDPIARLLVFPLWLLLHTALAIVELFARIGGA